MKKVRILCIDGGGIRGIIPGVILSYMERQLQIKDNSTLNIGDYFDFIAGTSTGGILACAYLMPNADNTAKFSAEDALKLYLDHGHRIFNNTLFNKLASGFGLWGKKYSVTNLESELKTFFGDSTLAELIKPCLITAYEMSDRRAYFFTSHDAKKPLSNFKVRDAARATSAAPTYFSPAKIKSFIGQEFSLIDGGVFANNPSLCAYAEVRKLQFQKIVDQSGNCTYPTAKDMLIVSIGTGTVEKPYNISNYKNAGKFKWLNPILDILMSANSETVDYQLKRMYETLLPVDQTDYYRIEPDLKEACPEMDDVTSVNLEHLRQAGLWCIDKNARTIDNIVDKLLAYK